MSNTMPPDESPDHGNRDGSRTGRRETMLRHAAKALGSEEKAERWLGKVNRALGGQTPESQLGSAEGFNMVKQLLTRIAHGVIG